MIKKIIKYSTLNMKGKIIVSCSIVMFFALFIQSLTYSRASFKVIYEQVREMNLSTLNRLQDEFYTINKSIENSLITIYNQKEFIRDLSYDNIDSLQSNKYKQLAYDIEHSSFELSQNVVAVYIYDDEYNLISFYRHAQTPKYSYSQNIYDKQPEEEKKKIESYLQSDKRTMLITSTYNKNRNLNIVRYILKIYDGERVIGHIVCDTDPIGFSKLLEKYMYSKSQMIWIQPLGDSTIVKSGNELDKYYDVYENISNRIKNEQTDFDELKISKDFEIFKAYELKYNFVVWSLIPKETLQVNQNILLRNMLIVLFVIFIFISLLFILISESLTKPLTYIINVMDKIKKGETKQRLNVNCNDEIGMLSNEFNNMLDEIEILNEKNYQSKILVNESKYKALQAQINPHFIYNTLETMSGVASAQNCDTVSTLCIALSNMFRYNLAMEDTNSTLEQEILHVKNYIYVMNVRLNGLININFDIESCYRDMKIPKLTLQPLIENSILHGFKNKDDKINIKISVNKNNNHFEIWVEDNGEGIDENIINEKLKNSITTSLNKNESIGLDNINARLQILFGEEYGLKVFNRDLGGTKVILIVPGQEVGI